MHYTIRGIDVEFPYNAYDCQLIYMEKVIQSLQEKRNALLESPTGTGKTLCLLCSTLAWRQSYVDQLRNSGTPNSQGTPAPVEIIPKIVYASRTHTQLTQAIKELKATSYRPKMCILGSRSQMCVHPTVSSMRGKQLDYACRALVSQHRCSHHETVAEHRGNKDFTEQVCDIEDMVTLGKQHGVCPYYLSRELQMAADIVFMPYNYLIDPAIRKSLNLNLEDAVIIFDEAHNLEGICAEAASFDFSAGELAACLRETQQAIDIISNKGFNGEIDLEELSQLKAILLKLEEKIDSFKLEKEGFTKHGGFIYDMLGELGITFETKGLLIKLIEVTTTMLHDETTGQRQALSLELFSSMIKMLYKVPLGDNHPSQYYKVHIHTEKSKSSYNGLFNGKQNKSAAGRTLSYWCFNPGVAMEDLQLSGVRSIILTSGTLSPLDSFAYELKTYSGLLENPHVITGSQVWVGVVCSGPSGQPLDSSYKNRDNAEYKTNLGNAIVNYARIVPDGVLVFFPSYSALSACIDAWKAPSPGSSSSVWERICSLKQPVVEPRESFQFSMAIEDFYQKIKELSGAIFFAVCRGKVSEGLDFADRNGRAVIITGLPYPALEDPKVKLKREYLDDCKPVGGVKTLKGTEWYSQQASRAVNQAVGRVIRHRHDYGAIILCDQRFSYKSTLDQLSLWLRPHAQVYQKFGEANVSLTKFFKMQSPTDPVVTTPTHSTTVPRTPKSITPRDIPNNTHQENLQETPHIPTTNTRSLVQSLDKESERAFSNSTHAKTTTTAPVTKLSEKLLNSSKAGAKSTPNSPKNTNNRSFLRAPEPPIVNNQAQDKKRGAKDYLAKVVRRLDATEYSQFQSALKGFKKGDLDIEALVLNVRSLFATPERVDLLEGFITFVPKKHQEKCKPLLSADSISKPTTEPERPPGPAPILQSFGTPSKRLLDYDLISGQPSRVSKKPKFSNQEQPQLVEKNGDQTAETSRSSAPEKDGNNQSTEQPTGCPICRGKVASPFSAKCGHVCCHACWQEWLKEKLECPVCREKIRLKQLTKLYFV